mgnify:FL=1
MFDKKKYYKEKIDPLVRQIAIHCAAEDIPCLMVFAVADDGVHTSYEREMYTPGEVIDEISEDLIPKCVNVLCNQFDVVPCSDFTNFSMDSPDNGVTDHEKTEELADAKRQSMQEEEL